MKKIPAFILTAAILVSALAFSASVSAETENPTENPSSFTADFTKNDNWSGDEAVLGYLNYNNENKFGTDVGWNNKTGSIISKQNFDLGTVFDSQFSLYTFYRNGNKNGVGEEFYIEIGDFKLAICDFQTRVVLYYKNNAVEGTTVEKADIAYPTGGVRDYKYTVHIEQGNISVESDLLKFTSDFSAFTSVDNAAVKLTINETWQIYKEWFYDLSVASDKRTFDKGDVNADGEINSLDLDSLRKYLLELENLRIKDTGDVNSDGNIDISDLVELNDILVQKSK